jgi:hypothetical protein
MGGSQSHRTNLVREPRQIPLPSNKSRPNGPAEPSPGLRPKADALGAGHPPNLRPDRPREHSDGEESWRTSRGLLSRGPSGRRDPRGRLTQGIGLRPKPWAPLCRPVGPGFAGGRPKGPAPPRPAAMREDPQPEPSHPRRRRADLKSSRENRGAPGSSQRGSRRRRRHQADSRRRLAVRDGIRLLREDIQPCEQRAASSSGEGAPAIPEPPPQRWEPASPARSRETPAGSEPVPAPRQPVG